MQVSEIRQITSLGAASRFPAPSTLATPARRVATAAMVLLSWSRIHQLFRERGRAFVRRPEQHHDHLRERLPPEVQAALDDLLALERSSRPPRALLFTAKTKSLGNMQHMDAGASVKVCDGAREPERAVIPAR
jgi:hypothetical protein